MMQTPAIDIFFLLFFLKLHLARGHGFVCSGTIKGFIVSLILEYNLLTYKLIILKTFPEMVNRFVWATNTTQMNNGAFLCYVLFPQSN